jgi:hypothetical protein
VWVPILAHVVAHRQSPEIQGASIDEFVPQ